MYYSIAEWTAAGDSDAWLCIVHLRTKTLREQLPAKLRNLLFSKCRVLRELPPLPPTLNALMLEGCPKLRSLSPFPASLQHWRCEVAVRRLRLPDAPPPRLKLLDFDALVWQDEVRWRHAAERASVGPWLPSAAMLYV